MANKLSETTTMWRVDSISGTALLVKIKSDKPLVSLDEVAPYLPQGAYTTLRTYHHTMVFHLEDHFDRLEETTRLAGKPEVLNRKVLRQALRMVIDQYEEDQELRLRLVLDLSENPGQVAIAASPLFLPSAGEYASGVWTVTVIYERQNPKAKLTTTIAKAADLRKYLPHGVNEALMVDSAGRILEGLSSNFFAVKEGVLFTAEKKVLSGITRQIILEEAEQASIPIHWGGFPVFELGKAQEAFISSSSRAVLPVRQVDDQIIGTGRPGPVTTLLSRRYQQRLKNDLDSI
jgi:branched-chain amino acid aminotransferase